MTHYLPAYVETPRNGRQRAVCGTWIDEKDFSTEPLCATCQAWLAEDDAGFASLTQDEEPEPPRKLTRQERLQGLADSGCDTWQEKRGER